MGYSGRYHAASLAAVFVALAIGILIGVGLADDVVSNASEEVEQSLRGDLDEAEAKVDDLEAVVERQTRFGSLAGPALVDGRLARDRVALIALGGIPEEETAIEAQQAVEAAGGELAAVVVIELPPELAALRRAAGGRFSGRGASVPPEAIGDAIGRQLVGGGPLVDRVREELFARFNGSLADVDRVVFVSQTPDELQGEISGEGRTFETALISAVDDRAAGTVGVERTSTDPTTVPVFSPAGISTVDNVEQTPGRVALVYALLGADGDFGVKETAGSLLPNLAPGQAPPDR